MRIACARLPFRSVLTNPISRHLLQHHNTPNSGGMVRVFSQFSVVLFFIVRTAYGLGSSFCTNGEDKYQHGEIFLPNDPDLKTTELPIGKCMQCQCKNGVVYCEEELCSDLDCAKPAQMTKICCHQCKGGIRKQEKTPHLVVAPLKQSKARKKYGCVSNNKPIKEGASWQPIIGPLGIMSCVKCTCNKGNVSCKRFECRELPCSHPRKQFGQCCPVCPTKETSEFGAVRCLPEASEVFVYKTPEMGKSTQIIEYGFLKVKDNSRNKLELHTWDTRQPIDRIFQVDHVPKFRSKSLIIVGATSFKHWSRYTRREKRLKQHCALNCPEKIVRLEETLKLYPITSRSRCNSDEIDVKLI